MIIANLDSFEEAVNSMDNKIKRYVLGPWGYIEVDYTLIRRPSLIEMMKIIKPLPGPFLYCKLCDGASGGQRRNVCWKCYEPYINGEEFQCKAAIWKALRSFKCESCKGMIQLTIHHPDQTYPTLGNEAPDEIQVLCWTCHKQEHPKRAAA